MQEIQKQDVFILDTQYGYTFKQYVECLYTGHLYTGPFQGGFCTFCKSYL